MRLRRVRILVGVHVVVDDDGEVTEQCHEVGRLGRLLAYLFAHSSFVLNEMSAALLVGETRRCASAAVTRSENRVSATLSQFVSTIAVQPIEPWAKFSHDARSWRSSALVSSLGPEVSRTLRASSALR